MPSLGNLYITLRVKTDSLDQGISNAKKSLNDLSGVARTTVKSITLLSAAAVGAGAGIIIGLVNSGRQAIDTQSKLAQTLDGTIGGLRAAEMAFGDAGVSTDEFYSAAQRMNRALGDATKQAGPAYDALKNLGLSAQQLLSLDIDKRFATIADAMAKQNITGAKAQDIMGDLGVRNANLANLMRQGGDAFRFQSDEVDRLGLRLSMVDAAQVEAANDSIGIFGDVLTGVQDQLTVAAAPYLTVLSEKFREAAVESGGFKSQTNTVIKSIITGFAKAADFVHGLQTVWQGFKVAYYGMSAGIQTVNEFIMQSLATVMDFTADKINIIIRKINELSDLNIGELDSITNSPFMKGMRGMAQESRDMAAASVTDLHNMAMEYGKYSAQATGYLKEVEEASKKAAEQLVKDRKGGGGGGGGPVVVDTGDKNAQDKYKKEMEAWINKQAQELEAVKQRYITEEELNRQHQETMAIIGSEYDAAKFESEEQWRSITEQAEAEHQERLTGIQKKASDARKAALGTALSELTMLMNTNSRKAFEVGKAAAISGTILSTIESAQKSYNSLAGIPIIGPALGAAAAAAAAAGGMARVSAIRSQSFGSGSGSAGSVTNQINQNSTPVGGQSGGGGGGNQTLTVAPIDPNAQFSGSAMIGFGQRLVDFQKDGGKVVFAQ